MRPDPDNAIRAWRALARFGAPLDALDLKAEDLAQPGTVFQVGLPPRRIDILTQISGVEFDQAWKNRTFESSEGLELSFLGRQDLLRNKKESGRPKDLADVALLEEQQGRG